MRDKLVNWLIQNRPKIYEDMINTNHYVDIHEPNKYHVEGSIWTHTMMVMTWVEVQHRNENYELDDIYHTLITAALLHDIGKPSAYEEIDATDTKPRRAMFKGHEGISAHMSIDILKELQVEFPMVYTDRVVEDVIRVVSLHGVLVETTDMYLNRLLSHFHMADKGGAIRDERNDFVSHYQARSYPKIGEKVDGKEVVVMVGLPNSGKSTYISTNLSEHYVLSRDNEIGEYYKSQNGCETDYNTMYKWIHGEKQRITDFNQYFDKKTHYAAKYEDKVVVDMTMMNLKSRRSMLNNFKNNGHEYRAVVMMTETKELEAREIVRSKEGKSIPDFVMSNMTRSFVYPVENEGYTDIKLVLS